MIKYQKGPSVDVLRGDSPFVRFGPLGGLHYLFWRKCYGVYFWTLFNIAWPLKRLVGLK
jgi:hypothetical protein